MFWETWCPTAKSVASQGAGMLTSLHAPKPQGNKAKGPFYGSKKQTEDKGKMKIVTRPVSTSRTKSRP